MLDGVRRNTVYSFFQYQLKDEANKAKVCVCVCVEKKTRGGYWACVFVGGRACSCWNIFMAWGDERCRNDAHILDPDFACVAYTHAHKYIFIHARAHRDWRRMDAVRVYVCVSGRPRMPSRKRRRSQRSKHQHTHTSIHTYPHVIAQPLPPWIHCKTMLATRDFYTTKSDVSNILSSSLSLSLVPFSFPHGLSEHLYTVVV